MKLIISPHSKDEKVDIPWLSIIKYTGKRHSSLKKKRHVLLQISKTKKKKNNKRHYVEKHEPQFTWGYLSKRLKSVETSSKDFILKGKSPHWTWKQESWESSSCTPLGGRKIFPKNLHESVSTKQSPAGTHRADKIIPSSAQDRTRTQT